MGKKKKGARTSKNFMTSNPFATRLAKCHSNQ